MKICFYTVVTTILSKLLNYFPRRLLRECNKDIEIGGIYFEKGSALLVPIFAIHYNNDYYPDPEKFDPERFFSSYFVPIA